MSVAEIAPDVVLINGRLTFDFLSTISNFFRESMADDIFGVADAEADLIGNPSGSGSSSSSGAGLPSCAQAAVSSSSRASVGAPERESLAAVVGSSDGEDDLLASQR